MATFIKEDSAEKLGKEVHIPNKLTNIMINKSNYYGEIDPTLKGYKRAKKIASAAEKEQYNTDKDKFAKSEDGVTLNYNELKRWNNALNHLPKNSDAFDANGGEKGKELVGDLMKQVRRDQQKVQMVPDVKKLVKDVEVNDKEVKPSKIGSADVYVNENKKIYINENHLHLLQEYYNQLTLPFDGKYHEVNGIQVPTKMDYEYFVDWLEEIGKPGKLQGNPNESIRNIIYRYLEDDSSRLDIARQIYDDMEDGGYLEYEFVDIFNEIKHCHSDFFAYDEDETEELFNPYGDADEFKSLLTREGQQWLDQKIIEVMIARINNEGFLWGCIEDNGLLYVERVVTLPSITDYEGTVKYSDGDVDYFQELNKSYNGVGHCWTWSRGEGEAYCGGNGIDITLKGWVRPCDVDWKYTLYLNGYSLNYEKEIRMKQNAVVQIDEIEINNSYQKLPIKLPIIVPA